jgi:methyl-accepting chemotaxis protein
MTFKWLVFLIIMAGVAMWWFMFIYFLRSGYLIYRTGRYFYKDLQPWIDQFKQAGENAQAVVGRISERGKNISAMGEELRTTLEEIADVMDEVKSHPYVKSARLASKFVP